MTEAETWARELAEHVRACEQEIRMLDSTQRVPGYLAIGAQMPEQVREIFVRGFVAEAHEKGYGLLSVTPVHYRHWRKPGRASEVSFPLGGYLPEPPSGVRSEDEVEMRIEALAVPLHTRVLPSAG